MKINVSNFANFENLTEIEINKEYQYKESGFIFNFRLTSFVNDGKYLYILGDVSEKVKQKYGINKLELILSLKPVYYSGMIRIMPKDSYFTNVDDNHLTWPRSLVTSRNEQVPKVG